MDNFGTSRTVYTVRHPEISAAIAKLNVADYYLSLDERKYIKERIDQVAIELRNWLSPVVDLTALPYSYHVNGTHNSIEQWMASETRPIYCLKGEYPYPSQLRQVYIVDTVAHIPNDAVVYMSNPFSSTGNYDTRYYDIKNPIILDIAYVGTTAAYQLVITPNTEQVFWSGSKPFGLGNFRTGYRFARNKDILQEQLKDTGYFNLLGIDILSTSLSPYSVTELHSKFYNQYVDICDRNNLTPSDSYLLASTTSDVCAHLKREDGTIRIPIGKLLAELNKFQ